MTKLKIYQWIITLLSKLINTICLPIRLVFAHEVINKMGLCSLRDERYDLVMEHCRGRLLDIGCGNNQLVRKYGHDSIGVDVYDFGGDAIIVENTSKLPFDDGSFDTVSFVASLNHIPNRREVLEEAYRLLSEGGRVVLTMISPLLGIIRHKMAWWDPDQHHRGIGKGEQKGLTHKYILSIMENAGFRYIERKRFIMGMNNLYIFEKKPIITGKN